MKLSFGFFKPRYLEQAKPSTANTNSSSYISNLAKTLDTVERDIQAGNRILKHVQTKGEKALKSIGMISERAGSEHSSPKALKRALEELTSSWHIYYFEFEANREFFQSRARWRNERRVRDFHHNVSELSKKTKVFQVDVNKTTGILYKLLEEYSVAEELGDVQVPVVTFGACGLAEHIELPLSVRQLVIQNPASPTPLEDLPPIPEANV